MSPDHIYIHSDVWEQFTEILKEVFAKQQSGHSRPQLISEKHFQRQLKMKAESEAAGDQIISSGPSLGPRDLAPTMIEVTNKNPLMELLQSEIFGPLLPLIKYIDPEAVASHVRAQGRPLALYIFSTQKCEIQSWLELIPSGGVGINQTLLHVGNHHLPFGGNGSSGIGRYHGWFSFIEFSHQRGILQLRWIFPIFRLFYPPYSKISQKWVSRLIRLMSKLRI